MLNHLPTETLQDTVTNLRGIISKSNAMKNNPCHNHEEEMRWLCAFFGRFAPLELVEMSLDLLLVGIEEIVRQRTETVERLSREAANQ